MIEITATHSIIPDGPATDIGVVHIGVKEIYDILYDQLRPVIDGNIILNLADIREENNQVLVRHFATTTENANSFIDSQVEPVAFWESHGIKYEISQREIDFDTVDTSTMIPVFDDNNILYGITEH